MLEWNQFLCADSLEIMEEIETRSVDLIFTSVPDLNDLNIKDISTYEIFISNAMDQFGRITKDTGFVAMCQTDRKINAQVYSNHAFIFRVMGWLGFVLKDYKIMRFHFPIVTNKNVIFNQWDWDAKLVEVNMKVGEAWYLDVRKPHRAVNGGDTERIHIVVDVESNQQLRNLIC